MAQNDISVIAKNLADYIKEEILNDDIELDVDDNLLTEVGVDSLGMLRLVGFIESNYNIKIAPIFLTIDNFRSITAISCFTTKLLLERE